MLQELALTQANEVAQALRGCCSVERKATRVPERKGTGRAGCCRKGRDQGLRGIGGLEECTTLPPTMLCQLKTRLCEHVCASPDPTQWERLCAASSRRPRDEQLAGDCEIEHIVGRLPVSNWTSRPPVARKCPVCICRTRPSTWPRHTRAGPLSWQRLATLAVDSYATRSRRSPTGSPVPAAEQHPARTAAPVRARRPTTGSADPAAPAAQPARPR